MTEQNPELEWDELTEEEHEALILISEHAVAPPLSPAARAVLDAYRDADIDDAITAAAVLRAAALYCKRDRVQLMVIADELESL
jgi:hypothetical protein